MRKRIKRQSATNDGEKCTAMKLERENIEGEGRTERICGTIGGGNGVAAGWSARGNFNNPRDTERTVCVVTSGLVSCGGSSRFTLNRRRGDGKSRLPGSG